MILTNIKSSRWNGNNKKNSGFCRKEIINGGKSFAKMRENKIKCYVLDKSGAWFENKKQQQKTGFITH